MEYLKQKVQILQQKPEKDVPTIRHQIIMKKILIKKIVCKHNLFIFHWKERPS